MGEFFGSFRFLPHFLPHRLFVRFVFECSIVAAGYTFCACGVVFILPLHLDALTGFYLFWH